MTQKQVAFEKVKEYHRPLTLKDISPEWATRLEEQRKRSLPLPMSFSWLRWFFEITNAKKCIVGEAYGFSTSYTNNCGECGRIGDRFSLYFAIRSNTKFEENKRSFIKHWNEKHRLDIINTS